MADIAEVTAELADLWPALAAALARDTADGGGTGATVAAQVVNPDVLHAMITLSSEIPGAVRCACAALSEPWQPRGIPGCLLQVPRLHARLCELRLAREERQLAGDAAGWLRLAKRALGLRKPDIPLGYACPYAEPVPEEHQDGCMLYAAGREGFLREHRDGLRVEWADGAVIYCASPDCAAAWPLSQWPHLGRLLRSPAMVT